VARLANPWPEGRTINARSRYGPRKHPITGKPDTFHRGVDVGGTFPVTAAADGTVLKVGWSPSGGGHTVLIDHGDLVTVYYHGAHKTKLTKGQRVQAGAFIYTSGSTGASTGAHLHFEVRRPGGRWGDTLNPENFLPKQGENVTAEAAPIVETVTPQVVAPPRVPFTPTGPIRPTADLMGWLLKRKGR
jgi:murein DD-endopeptidase MepM/ murein hydrolase activator NlpD